jgi:ABC-type multidrug transport system ATPase subunit
MIEVHGLTKVLGRQPIVNHVTFSIDSGIVALLGRNGAGKTTLMRLLTGIWKPFDGSVRIAGHDLSHDPVSAKRELGYQPEHPDLHPRMRPRELLNFAAAARGLDRAEVTRVAEQLEIAALLDTRCGSLSQGQRRLVTLAAAIMHRPAVLLLDEPTNALDTHRVATLKRYLESEAGPRATLVSTHQLDFVVTIASRFILMREGRVIADGTIDELGRQLQMPGATLEKIVLKAT